MLVVVERECIGTVGWSSKSHALRMRIKQPQGKGTVCALINLSQRADGHLTSLRGVTYPARGHATREITFSRSGSSSKLNTKTQKERRMRDSSQSWRIGFPRAILMSITIIFITTCVSLFVGFSLGFVFSEAYKSKKACRECFRRIIEYGFVSDGTEYKVAQKK